MIVAYNNQIVMEPTLEAGLARIFGGDGRTTSSRETQDNGTASPASPASAQTAAGAPPAAPGTAAPTLDALADEAQQHYTRAIEAQRAGDWAKYGEEIRQLGATLERMRGR